MSFEHHTWTDRLLDLRYNVVEDYWVIVHVNHIIARDYIHRFSSQWKIDIDSDEFMNYRSYLMMETKNSTNNTNRIDMKTEIVVLMVRYDIGALEDIANLCESNTLIRHLHNSRFSSQFHSEPSDQFDKFVNNEDFL